LNLKDNEQIVFLHAAKSQTKWKYKFDKKNNKQMQFLNYGDRQQIKKITFMNSKQRAKMITNKQYSAIILPFENEERFLMICPTKDYRKFVADLSYMKLNEMLTTLNNENEEEVSVTIPKVRVISGSTLETFKSKQNYYDFLKTPFDNEIKKPITFSTFRMSTMLDIDEDGLSFFKSTSATVRYNANQNFQCNRPMVIFVLAKKVNIVLVAAVIDKPNN
ncbi:serpin 5-like protein, partial [Leptotrombidium deliense]